MIETCVVYFRVVTNTDVTNVMCTFRCTSTPSFIDQHANRLRTGFTRSIDYMCAKDIAV